MSDKNSIVKEAVKDAKAIKELAVEAAKNEILEMMAPQVRALVERELRSSVKKEDVDRLRRAEDGYGETEFEEGSYKGDQVQMEKDEKELDLESLGAMFPALSEMEEELPEARKSKDDDDDESEADVSCEVEAESAIPTLGEAEEGKEGDMDEEVEISEAELRKVYQEALKTEADVSKGFKDMTAAGELDEVDPAAGIADVKKGEAQWDAKTSLPPEKKDWTVSEIKALVQRGIEENKKLRETNAKLASMVKALGTKLTEQNLFNSKVIHVNKMLSNVKLTREQKKAVIESIDRATSIDEVKKIYLTLESSFKTAGVVSESRKPKANAAGARRSGAADQKVISESVDKSADTHWKRLQQLAGLVK